MADSFIHLPFGKPHPVSVTPVSAIRVLIYGLSVATVLLMAIGSATRVMNAGLACPDWPLCYGSLVPATQMNLQVFLEWFHRLVASSMGLMVTGLTVATWRLRRTLPGWLPIAMTLSLGIILLQGILGGLTVTQLLRFDIVTAHLATGLLFFTSMIVIASFLKPYQGTGMTGNLYSYSAIAALCVYLQSILGALVASQWAVHQCVDDSRLCHVLHSHILSAAPVGISILILGYRTWKVPALHPTLRRLVQGAIGLLLLQVTVGVSTLRLHLHVEWLTVSHQAIAAILFGTLVCLSVLSWRDKTENQYQLTLARSERAIDPG